jgi:heptosyltransferase-1
MSADGADRAAGNGRNANVERRTSNAERRIDSSAVETGSANERSTLDPSSLSESAMADPLFGVRRSALDVRRSPSSARKPVFDSPPSRILIIKPSAIGDVVHALPVLNLLRKKWPASHISWLVTPGCAGLLDGHPQLNEVIRFDRRKLGNSWRDLASAVALHDLGRELQSKKFDLVIDLQGLMRSGLLGFRTGAAVRVGSTRDREFGWMFQTHLAPVDRDGHAVDRYLAVADYLGLGRSPVDFVFPTDDADRAAAAPLLPDGPFAVLLPGTNWVTKRWPAEKFAALVRPLRERFGLATVVAGSADDSKLAAMIPGAVDLTGRTPLRQLVAVLEKASLVIANDTGPMHIAAALGRPLVAVYGPTDPAQTGPYGRDDSVVRLDLVCSPCFSRKCTHRTCLVQLDVEHVLRLAAVQVAATSVQLF